MPVRNTVRFDVSEGFYHVYNRGVNRCLIFLEPADKHYFLMLLGRYLSSTTELDARRLPYASFYGKLEINSFCLMENHFHLLCYQVEQGALKEFMKAVSNSYIGYFNKKYERRGPLFESRYKASLIQNDSYLAHISRYIHLNPRDWQTCQFSSLSAYIGRRSHSWLSPARILNVFEGEDYLEFVKDYESHKQVLQQLKDELAD